MFSFFLFLIESFSDPFVLMGGQMMHWSRAPVSGLLPSRHLRAHSMTLVDSTIWIFGGTDESDSRDDIYTLDTGELVTWPWPACSKPNTPTETFVWGKPKHQGDVPPPSRAHTATLVQNRYIFIVGGGQDFVYYNTLYVFSPHTMPEADSTALGQVHIRHPHLQMDKA